jgi:DNA-binding transcriptional LysR family regulator
MTLVQLRHFIALAQKGSFAQAAMQLHLTQPALSRSIRALEDELGHTLFDRIGRHCELTPFGRNALEHARELTMSADDLRASGQVAGDGLEGIVRIGMGSGPGSMLMTPLLLQVALERPRLRVKIARAGTDLLVQALRERTLDGLVIDLRSLRPAPDLVTHQVTEMKGSFMVRRGHPLLRKRRQVTFAELQRYPLASVPLSDEVSRVLVERYGPQAHPSICVTLSCEELPSLVDVTRRSDTVLLAIRASASDLVEINVQPPLAATARFGLVTLRRRTEPPGLRLVRTLMSMHLVDS